MGFNRKGQSSVNIVGAMVVMVVVGFMGIVGLTVFDSIETSMTSTSSSTDADATIANFTENYYDGMELASNTPLILAAGLLLSVIMGFAMYVRG